MTKLGDWYLTMAGYNWGTGNVQRAVEKTGYADFWELYKRNNLPAETKSYVPEILAAIIIANHPEQYGFDEITLDPPVLTDTVTINYSASLRLVSDIVGAPLDELTALNPSLLRGVTPPETSFDLHLPAGTATLFEERMAKIPEDRRNAWRYHRVTAKDTLASVAHEYRVSLDALAEANDRNATDALVGVEALVVPASPAAEPTSAHTRLYTVRRGDTLVTIADRYGVSLNQLREWNHISGMKVSPGQRLRVTGHEAGATSHAHSSRSRHHASIAEEVEKSKAAPAREAAPAKAESDQRATRSEGKRHGASESHRSAKTHDHDGQSRKGQTNAGASDASSRRKSRSHRSTKGSKSK